MERIMLAAMLLFLGILSFGSYYQHPVIFGAVAGIILLTFITKVVDYPNAGFVNSTLLISGWIGINWVISITLPNTNFSAVLIFTAYFFLLKSIFKAPLTPSLILTILSTIFRQSIAVAVLPHLSKAMYLAP